MRDLRAAAVSSMTPAARFQAAIELLADILASPKPADSVVASYLRERRYIGAGDRGWITGRVYALLRREARLSWWLHRVGAPKNARTLMIADQVLTKPPGEDGLSNLFSGGKFAAPELARSEKEIIEDLRGHTLDTPQMPEAVRVECPEWAEPELRRAFGPRFAVEMAALLEEAPLDLRINRLKARPGDTASEQRRGMMAKLAKEGIETRPTKLSPLALRATKRVAVGANPSFQDGLFEVQDEGSQLAALLVDAHPAMQVLDLCAGAGGKTLAIAATMENKGRIIASDVLEGRLARSKLRFRRAGAHNIETRALNPEAEGAGKELKRLKGKFDRVLVDAPCTGTGTWRRNPDMRWRRQGPDISELTSLQARLLDKAAPLVKPGGRLIYVTCSLLPAENETQCEAFLKRRPDFAALDLAELWPSVIAAQGGGGWPGGGPYLRLTPHRHETDGFFVAAFERAAMASAQGDGEDGTA
jgi:16S rRNA (cytosine967-C5)-methyltransferase